MKIVVLALLLSVGVTGPAWARLGETEDQLVARYGPETLHVKIAAQPGQVVLDRIMFQKANFQIAVLLFNGVSSEERISKNNRDSWKDDEITTLLNANAPTGQSWKEVPKQDGNIPWPPDNGDGMITNPDGKMWQRDDGSMATTGFQDCVLFRSKALADAEAAAHQAIHTNGLDGF